MKKILLATVLLATLLSPAIAGEAETAYGMVSVIIYKEKCGPVGPKAMAEVQGDMKGMSYSMAQAVEQALHKLVDDIRNMGGEQVWCARAKPIIERNG